MTAYETMIKTNHHLIRGGELNDTEKSDIVKRLLAEQVGTVDDDRVMKQHHAYPKFFVPPRNNGKRLQTVIPMSPKTYQTADNAYEFEIIRLLQKFMPPNDKLSNMIDVTSKRLKHTCFGYKGCYHHECFDAGMVVLRFLSFAVTDDKKWIQKQLDMYNNHFHSQRRSKGIQKYYWFVLSEMPLDIAESEIWRQSEHIAEHLNGSYLIKNGNEDVALCAMRNTLARLEEYEHIKNRKPYVDEKTGRLRFNMDKREIV